MSGHGVGTPHRGESRVLTMVAVHGCARRAPGRPALESTAINGRTRQVAGQSEPV